MLKNDNKTILALENKKVTILFKIGENQIYRKIKQHTNQNFIFIFLKLAKFGLAELVK